MPTKRSAEQCRKRWNNSNTVKKGFKSKKKYSEEQDITILLARKFYFNGLKGGSGSRFAEDQLWRNVTQHLPGLTSMQAQDRFSNKLDPAINEDPWSDKEKRRMIELVAKFGEYRTPWAKIARNLGTNRTGRQVRMQWNMFKYKKTNFKRKKKRPRPKPQSHRQLPKVKILPRTSDTTSELSEETQSVFPFSITAEDSKEPFATTEFSLPEPSLPAPEIESDAEGVNSLP